MNLAFVTKKLIAAFFILIIYIKISGRKQLAPLSPSDQIGNMVMGALISNSIVSPSVSILKSIIIVSIWACLQLFLRYLKFKSNKITEIVDGKKYLLIKNGIIQEDAFKNAQISLLDFENNIHNQDVKSISQIKNAWFDSSGNISLDLKGEESQSNVLLYNGKINSSNLKRLKISEEYLYEILYDNGLDNNKIKQILCIEFFNNNFYVYGSNKNIIIKR